MWRNEFNTLSLHPPVQWIAVISLITNQLTNFCFAESVPEGLFHQIAFKGCGRKHLYRMWPAVFCGNGHDLGAFAPLGFAYARTPFFA